MSSLADYPTMAQSIHGLAENGRSGPMYLVPGKWQGLVQPGNIDLNNRPRVQNPDGSISTVKSISFGINGHEVLVPQVVGNAVVSPHQALQHYLATGQHLGIFRSPADANAYAIALHLQQAGHYT